MTDSKIFLLVTLGLIVTSGVVVGWLAAKLFRDWRFSRRAFRQKFNVYRIGTTSSRASAVRTSLVRTAPAVTRTIALCVIVYLGLTYLSPSPTVTLRHLVAFFNCDAARAVGLAPARMGQPGYWHRNDRGRDGIACEPWKYRQGTPFRF